VARAGESEAVSLGMHVHVVHSIRSYSNVIHVYVYKLNAEYYSAHLVTRASSPNHFSFDLLGVSIIIGEFL
jgi:hypothetical protein